MELQEVQFDSKVRDSVIGLTGVVVSKVEYRDGTKALGVQYVDGDLRVVTEYVPLDRVVTVP